MCVSLITVTERARDTIPLQQETVFSWSLLFPENGTCQFLTLSAKPFLQRLQLIPPDLLLNLHCTMTWLFPQTLSAKLFPKTLSASYLKPNQGIKGLNSSSSSIKMIRMTLSLLIMSFFLSSSQRPGLCYRCLLWKLVKLWYLDDSLPAYRQLPPRPSGKEGGSSFSPQAGKWSRRFLTTGWECKVYIKLLLLN